MLKLPSYYQNKVTNFLKQNYPELKTAPYHSVKLRNWTWQLSNLFRNKNYFAEGKYFKQKEMIAAYLSYIFPQSFVKIYYLLSELNEIYFRRKILDEEINILDVGGGVGSSALASIEFFKKEYAGKKINLDFVEINREPTLFFSEIIKDTSYFSDVKSQIFFWDIERFIKKVKKKYNLIILSSLLRELELKISLVALIRKIISKLKEEGLLIIVEPALKEASQKLIELRDKLISYDIFIISPCLHNNLCPVAGDERYWCYREINWKPPSEMQILNKKLYRELNPLKFSYLIIGARVNIGARVMGKEGVNYYRALTPIDSQRGKWVIKACDEKGNFKIIELLKRDVSEKNEIFCQIKRGDLFLIDKIQDKGNLLRIKKESQVDYF